MNTPSAQKNIYVAVVKTNGKLLIKCSCIDLQQYQGDKNTHAFLKIWF